MAIATYPNPDPIPSPRHKPVRRPQRARTRVDSLRNTLRLPLGLSITKRFFNRKPKSKDGNTISENLHQKVDLINGREARKSTSNIPDKLIPFPLSSTSSSPSEAAWQSYNFSFPLPSHESQKMPPSFSCSNIVDVAGIRGRAYAENAEV